MKWFGQAYGAPYERELPKVPTPVGHLCGRCHEPIEAQDSGLIVPHVAALGAGAVDRPYHYECHFRAIVGGLNHLKGRCTCCGGTNPPDPPEMTPRQAARAAVAYWQGNKGAR